MRPDSPETERLENFYGNRLKICISFATVFDENLKFNAKRNPDGRILAIKCQTTITTKQPGNGIPPLLLTSRSVQVASYLKLWSFGHDEDIAMT